MSVITRLISQQIFNRQTIAEAAACNVTFSVLWLRPSCIIAHKNTAPIVLATNIPHNDDNRGDIIIDFFYIMYSNSVTTGTLELLLCHLLKLALWVI